MGVRIDVCAHTHLFKFASSQACTCASMCVSILAVAHMPCIRLPWCGFFLCPGKPIKVLPLKSLLWHIISLFYKGNLSKPKLKGKERGGGPGIGVVGEIPVSSENISCPRVLVAAAGVLTHHQPPASLTLFLSLAPTHTPTRTDSHFSLGSTKKHKMSHCITDLYGNGCTHTKTYTQTNTAFEKNNS